VLLCLALNGSIRFECESVQAWIDISDCGLKPSWIPGS